jgi:hypothetical protein
VFSKQAFSSQATSDFILVSLDFPKGEEAMAKVPNPERNEELMRKYQVDYFPTVLLMTPQGEVFGKSGYTGATPEAYLKDVRDQRSKGKLILERVQAVVQTYEAAADKMRVVGDAIELLTELEDAAAARPLVAIVRSGFTLDPKDEHGLKVSALMALMKSRSANEEELSMAATVDADNKFGLLEYVVAGAMNGLRSKEDLAGFLVEAEALHETGKVHDADLVSFLWVNSAYFCHKYLDRPEEAVIWAKRAKELGNLDKDAEEVLEDILGEEDPA